jgi:hypothetical protein
MPVLEYGSILEPGGMYRAQLAVRSVLAWPHEENRRQQYIATVWATHLAELQKEAKELQDAIAAGKVSMNKKIRAQFNSLVVAIEKVAERFNEAGGYGAVAQAPGLKALQKEILERVDDWFAAGLVLALVRRMAKYHMDLPGGASVNKAVFILERVRPPLIARNTHDLRRAWSIYKPVAHFCAALFDLFIYSSSGSATPKEVLAVMNKRLNQQFPVFLAEAAAYEEFGLNYCPARTKGKPLLDAAATWLLPADRPWPRSPMEPTPLGDRLLAAALEYRAPISGV